MAPKLHTLIPMGCLITLWRPLVGCMAQLPSVSEHPYEGGFGHGHGLRLVVGALILRRNWYLLIHLTKQNTKQRKQLRRLISTVNRSLTVQRVERRCN